MFEFDNSELVLGVVVGLVVVAITAVCSWIKAYATNKKWFLWPWIERATAPLRSEPTPRPNGIRIVVAPLEFDDTGRNCLSYGFSRPA